MTTINIIDKLIENTIKTKNPTVVGLDPDLKKIPNFYKPIKKSGDPLKNVADVILRFNKDVIDTVFPFVPAVKPQIAFYEKYGSYGVRAFEKTAEYARSKGLVVIEDGKRNDIGNTAKAYADGHLGLVESLGGEAVPSLNADLLTVSPFLGSESMEPFINVCAEHGKGVFILVKTSNPSSGEIQDILMPNGKTVSQTLAEYVADNAKRCMGVRGYSSIGAVVGATYPEEAQDLRKRMPKSYFLVPGYGAQGGGPEDIIPCFNPDGLGSVVNSSRGILYNHMTDSERENCSREEYLENLLSAVKQMQSEIYNALKNNYPNMIY